MNPTENSFESVVKQIESILNTGLDNIYINTAIKVFLGLYAAFAAPSLPPNLVFLMDNTFVRISVAFVIILMATRDPSMALIMAIAFIMTLQTANKLRIINTSLSYSEPGESSWLPSAKKHDHSDHDSEDDDSSDDDSSDDDSDDTDINVTQPSMVQNNMIQSNQVPTQNSILESMENPPPPTTTPVVNNNVENTTTTSVPVNVSENPFFRNVSDQDEANISLSRPSDNLNEPAGEPAGLLATDDAAPLFTGVPLGSNEIPGANQDSSINTFGSQHPIQGIGNSPTGYN